MIKQIDHLAIVVTDLERSKKFLRSSDSRRTWEKTGKRLVYFHGPDGVLMELAQYPENEN